MPFSFYERYTRAIITLLSISLDTSGHYFYRLPACLLHDDAHQPPAQSSSTLRARSFHASLGSPFLADYKILISLFIFRRRTPGTRAPRLISLAMAFRQIAALFATMHWDLLS